MTQLAQYIPDIPSWQDDNVITSNQQHLSLCEYFYKSLAVVAEGESTRIVSKYYQMSDNDIRALANLFGPVEKTPLSIWKLLNWAIHPLSARTRNYDNEMLSFMDQPNINAKLVLWHHEKLIRNIAPNAPEPEEPSLVDSFFAFLEKMTEISNLV